MVDIICKHGKYFKAYDYKAINSYEGKNEVESLNVKIYTITFYYVMQLVETDIVISKIIVEKELFANINGIKYSKTLLWWQHMSVM